MAELVEVGNIPATAKAIYPWAEWISKLQNGQALKLSRADMPKQSAAYKKWKRVGARGTLLRNEAARRGFVIASRGDHIYLWKL